MKAGSLLSAIALLLATSTLSAAQQSANSPPPMPPAPAALAVPDPLAGFTPGPQDLYRSPDGSDRFQHVSPYPPPPPPRHHHGGYIPLPYYPYYPLYDPTSYYGYAPKHRHSPARPFFARGGLVLETIPDLAQVYVDGFYVGFAEEFGLRGRALDLTEGPHQVELRAPGYNTLTFSVMIEPNGIVRYRGDMQLMPSAATLPRVITAPPVSPKSYYVIPNCYAGDKPPRSPLPKGCNLKNLQTRK